MAPLGRTPPARFKASVCLTHLVAIYHTAPFGAITLCVLPDLFPLTFICNSISLSLSHSLQFHLFISPALVLALTARRLFSRYLIIPSVSFSLVLSFNLLGTLFGIFV